MADYLNIAGRIRTTASDGVGIEAQEVKDLNLNKSQQEINADVQTELGNRYTKEETYSKEQLDDLITTPDVNYVSVVATDATTAVTDVLPATGEANTIYRVGNWDGTQYDPTMYALFAWNGSAYVCLAVRSFVGEVYDISVNHPDGQGNPTPYADLSAALGTDGANIPADIRSGGMRIQFIQGTVQSSDNTYVQFRYMGTETTGTPNPFLDTINWQGVDDEPTAGSNNLVKSGGVEEIIGHYINNIPNYIYAKTDSENRILHAIKEDGTNVLPKIENPEITAISNSVNFLNDTVTLSGKTIVCIGDSITEFAGQADHKTYPQHIAEKTGATVINIGIGGTTIRESSNPVIDQSAGYKESNYAALSMVDIVRAACGEMYDTDTSYLELAQIAAEYIRDNKPSHDDNTAQIERLAAINWSKVDIVTILGGTNDWRYGSNAIWGNSDSNDASTTFGAINEIVRILCSTYKHIKLFWFTPLIRWEYYATQPLLENYSDVFEVDGTNLKEFANKLQNVVFKNHIPICDLYNGLGWNSYNFSDYFSDTYDGVHPVKGFGMRDIALKISDFLTAGTTNGVNLNEIKSQLQAKVDKVEGKSLIDAEYAASQSVIENSEWLEVKTDSENRILEGIKTDGTKVVESAIETPSAITYSTQSSEWLNVTIDNEDKIIEGTRSNGEKYVNEFDDETKDSIRNLVSEVINEYNIFSIPNLNASFSTSLKYKVYNGSIEDNSVKGTENAKYVFNLDVKDSWIVRFKFRITENLLNQNKNADVASIDGAKVTAKVFQLTQHQETYTFEDVEYTENWPTVDGGIAFNQAVLDNKLYGRNLGQQAFSIKYIGSGNEVTIENNGSGLIITIDGTATTYNFSSYANMNELFAALSSDSDLELQYIALDKRLCNELAKFGPVHLKSTFYTDENGTYGSNMNIQPHIDCAPFYLYYAISDKWHQVEIFKIGNKIYSACDGNVTQTTVSQNSGELTLGGDCGVLFKDFVFCGDGVLDTEFINNKVVSSVSPYIIIFECHGMYDGAAYTATPAQTEQGMSSLNPDTLEYYYSILDSKGYLPVSMDDIAEFYTNGKPLPKRCYVHTFDDARWPVCFNLKFRSVYRKHGAKPAIVLITDYNTTITYNGSTITEEEAVKICHNAGFSIVSHTKDHRDIPRGTKPSQYIEYFTNDVIDGDLKQADGSIIVYPGGQSNTYSHDVMEYLGIRLGIQITQSMSITNLSKSRFSLSRINIGRTIKTDGTPIDYTIYTNNII